MQQELSPRFAGSGRVWLDEVPDWAAVPSIGYVESYWRWRGEAPVSACRREAGWGYRLGLGGSGQYGLLAGTFEPHEFPFLRVDVAVSQNLGRKAERPFHKGQVGLPPEYVGGAIVGILHAPELFGPGRLNVEWAVVHEVDSSWEVFRILGIGLARLFALPLGQPVPDDLLPHFHAVVPPSPGSD